ncbi:MAG TPA: D-glycerate dehydrogenase [Terriglobales bacterium]
MSTLNARIFVTCDIGTAALDKLRQRGYEVEVYPGPEPPPKSLIVEKANSGIAGLITTLRDPIDAEVFQAGKGKLKGVAQIAVGFDNINRADANRYKIPFTNTADVLTDATAEFAFFMLGAAARKLWPSELEVRENRWGAWHPFLPFLGDEVTGKTLGVVGTGRIGQAVICKSLGFEMNVLCYDPVFQNIDFVESVQEVMNLSHERGLQHRRTLIEYGDLDHVLEMSDFVSLHVPLIRQGEGDTPTFHLINATTLRKMKPHAYLINTSRGPVVDESALYTALKEKWIAGAALDVFEKEPLPPDSPLRDPEIADRCRLFHHFASGGKATRLSPDPNIGMAGRCVQGMIDMLELPNPADSLYVVNKEAFS